MRDIHKIYPALTILAIVIVACILFLRKPIMQLLKDRLHNPFKYEGIEKGSFWASWTLVIIVVLKIMIFEKLYLGRCCPTKGVSNVSFRRAC